MIKEAEVTSISVENKELELMILSDLESIKVKEPTFELYKREEGHNYNQTNNPLWFQILDNEYKGIFYPVHCKDYIQDVYWAEIMKENINVYGFYWKHDNPWQISSKERVKVALSNPDYAQEPKLCNYELVTHAQKILNDFEDVLNIPHSIIEMYPNMNIVVFDYSNKWADRPYLISLYYLIIRLLTPLNSKPTDILDLYTNCEKYNYRCGGNYTEERNLCRGSLHAIKCILKGYALPEQLWSDYTNVNYSHKGVHNYSGIISSTTNLFSKIILNDNS